MEYPLLWGKLGLQLEHKPSHQYNCIWVNGKLSPSCRSMYHSCREFYRWTFIIAGARFVIPLVAVFNITNYSKQPSVEQREYLLLTFLFLI